MVHTTYFSLFHGFHFTADFRWDQLNINNKYHITNVMQLISMPLWNIAGSHISGDPFVLLHEPPSSGDLAVRVGRLRAGVHHHVHCGTVLPLRVAQPSPLWHREWPYWEPVLPVKQLLVHNRNSHAARVWPQPEGNIARLLFTYICVWLIMRLEIIWNISELNANSFQAHWLFKISTLSSHRFKRLYDI